MRFVLVAIVGAVLIVVLFTMSSAQLIDEPVYPPARLPTATPALTTTPAPSPRASPTAGTATPRPSATATPGR